jgi:hypothetical protein
MDIQEIKTSIVADLNIGNLPPLVQDSIIEKLGQSIMEKVVIESFKKIPDDKMDEFDSLSGPDEIQKFLASYIPNYDVFVRDLVSAEIVEFKKLAKLG